MRENPEDPTILITGGAGFVGSSLALHWKALHPESRVIAFDNLKRRGSELNLPRLRAAGIEYVHGDVREASDLMVLPKIDVMIECSAEPSVLAGYGAGAQYVVDTNLKGTLNCLDLVVRDKAGLIFLSTSRVYPIDPINSCCVIANERFGVPADVKTAGISDRGISEEFTLAGVRSLYGTTKLCSELLIAEYAAIHGIPAVIDRCGVIAGPWQMGRTDQGFVLYWLTRHHWGLPLKYTGFGGKGHQVRDVLHIDDLCDLITHQLKDLATLSGRTFNVGGGIGNAASLNEFTELAGGITGRRISVGADPVDRQGDLKWYVTDNSKIGAAAGWSPKRDLETIFTDSYVWLKKNEEELRAILD